MPIKNTRKTQSIGFVFAILVNVGFSITGLVGLSQRITTITTKEKLMHEVKHIDFWRFTLSFHQGEALLGYYIRGEKIWMLYMRWGKN